MNPNFDLFETNLTSFNPIWNLESPSCSYSTPLEVGNKLDWVLLIQGVPHQYGLHQYDFHQYEFYCQSIKLVLLEFLCTQYVVKFVLVEIDYVVPTSTNFAQYDFSQVPKIILSEDPCSKNEFIRLVFLKEFTA